MATTSDRSRSKSSSEGDSLTSLLMRCELCIFVHSRRRRRRLDRLYLCARSKFMSAIDAQLDAHCNYIHVLVSVRCAPVHQATDFYDGTGPKAHCGFSCRSCFFFMEIWKLFRIKCWRKHLYLSIFAQIGNRWRSRQMATYTLTQQWDRGYAVAAT